jgi:uncharacterized membrane protein YhaH (DUF805 family)
VRLFSWLGPVSRRSEAVAAVVNGLLVVLLPLTVLVALSSINLDSSDASVTARDPEPPSGWPMAPILIRTAVVLAPFALLAAWRTWVYARRWCDREARGWWAVAEAGACGLILALLYLAPGIVTRPAEAPPYVIAYGGAAWLLGVLMGLFLRTTAILVLRSRITQ